MKKAEFTKELNKIFFDAHALDLCGAKVTLVHNPKDCELEIIVSQMYEYVEVGFDKLAAMAALCETDHINIGEKDFSSGCETCDWGSSYMVYFFLKGFTMTLEG